MSLHFILFIKTNYRKASEDIEYSAHEIKIKIAQLLFSDLPVQFYFHHIENSGQDILMCFLHSTYERNWNMGLEQHEGE